MRTEGFEAVDGSLEALVPGGRTDPLAFSIAWSLPRLSFRFGATLISPVAVVGRPAVFQSAFAVFGGGCACGVGGAGLGVA